MMRMISSVCRVVVKNSIYITAFVTATMSDLSHTPSTLISIGRCMRSQLSTHGVMRGGGTIRSIASDVEAATCGDAGRAIAFVAASRGALAAVAGLLRICDGVCIHGVLGHDETDASTRGRLAGVAPWPAPRRRRATLVWAFWEGPCHGARNSALHALKLEPRTLPPPSRLQRVINRQQLRDPWRIGTSPQSYIALASAYK